MTNSAVPDQLASSEANGSGSTLFAKTGHVVFSKRRVNDLIASEVKYHTYCLLIFFFDLHPVLHRKEKKVTWPTFFLL